MAMVEKKIMKWLMTYIATVFFSFSGLAAQDTLSIMTYNVLNFPGSTPERVIDFRKVLDEYRPDILVLSEMLSRGAMNTFLDSTLNYLTTEYTAGPIFEGFDTENSAFYKHDRVEFIDALSVTTALRRIDGYRFKIRNHADSTFQFQIFSAHLKASQGTDNVAKRLAEVKRLDDSIKAGNVDSSYIFACDCNFYTSTESGYQYLMESMAIDLEDPINSPGNWHNSASFASIHTQSTRTTQFGGGATGGLDDRFDFILLSEKFFDEENLWYVDGSYTAIGNDHSHFNLAINQGTNSAVPADIADALHAASDHLPVMLKLAYPTEIEIGIEEDETLPEGFLLKQNYPNPFNPVTTIEYELSISGEVSLVIYNLMGEEVTSPVEGYQQAGQYKVVWNGSKLSSGIYFYRLQTGDLVQTKKMILLK